MLFASAATAVAITLAGCDTETLTKSSLRASQPLSPKVLAEIEQKDMSKESPILVRIFKEEAELEVWKQTREGRYALLKTYPICRWSGELGPKVREGDRQAPEGFYTITPGQMNPNSNYYLAFNMGYPNSFDRAHGRTGSQLMVHGDCSSRGCYAMTDEQMGEIYALARESFFGGQKSFQVQAFPFRMTPRNMARHRANPHLAFWRNLKLGYDHFEVTRIEPKVDVCEKRYVFNAEAPGDASTPLSFSPAGTCPTYEVPADILAAVQEKQQRDRARVAELIATTPVAPIKTGSDGGMNAVYLAALKPDPEAGRLLPVSATAHGTIPQHVNPPRAPQPVYASAQTADEPARLMLATAEGAPDTRQSEAGGEGFFARVGKAMGFQSETAEQPKVLAGRPRTIKPAPRKPEPKPQIQVATAPAAKSAQPTPAPQPRDPVAVASVNPASAKPELRGSRAPPAAQSAPASTRTAVRAPARAPTGSLSSPSTMTSLAGPVIRGAQPALKTGSFESRWSALQR
jgi:murein L,D-transpeptidase YafK